MNGLGIFLLVVAVMLSVIVIGILIFGDLRDDNTMLALFLCTLFAMGCWFGVGFKFGVKDGAEKTAKGVFKTHLVTDNDGKVVDTIVDWK